MKRFVSKLCIFFIFTSVLFIDGCRKEQDSEIDPSPGYVFLKDVNHVELKEFSPDLLPLVRQDLINKNKESVAERLTNTYNFKTGKAYPEAIRYLESVSKKSQARTNMVWNGTWLSDDMSGDQPSDLEIPNASGTIVLGADDPFWLIIFGLNSPTTYPTTWGASNSVSFNAYVNTSGWISPTAVNDNCSVGWNTSKFEAVWFWAGSQIACYTYYRVLLTNNTWTPWKANGATCGTPGSGLGIRKIELTIASVENCS